MLSPPIILVSCQILSRLDDAFVDRIIQLVTWDRCRLPQPQRSHSWRRKLLRWLSPPPEKPCTFWFLVSDNDSALVVRVDDSNDIVFAFGHDLSVVLVDNHGIVFPRHADFPFVRTDSNKAVFSYEVDV